MLVWQLGQQDRSHDLLPDISRARGGRALSAAPLCCWRAVDLNSIVVACRTMPLLQHASPALQAGAGTILCVICTSRSRESPVWHALQCNRIVLLMCRAMPRLQHASHALQAGAARRPLRGMLWEPHLPQGSLLPSRYHAGGQVTSALHAVPRKPLQGRL